MDLHEFRKRCPYLVHYAPQIDVSTGLLTAAQLLDRHADEEGNVWAKFRNEAEFMPYPVDHWKRNSRFLRNAGEAGSCLQVRDATNPDLSHILGNNYPLGDGKCLGTTIKLTDNRPNDAEPSKEEWFRTLNDMFWVFSEGSENLGFINRLRKVTPNGKLYRLRLTTGKLSNYELEDRVRLSAINGGGSNGGFARGTFTYKRISEWSIWPPKEIGLLHGLPAAICATLLQNGGLRVEVV